MRWQSIEFHTNSHILLSCNWSQWECWRDILVFLHIFFPSQGHRKQNENTPPNKLYQAHACDLAMLKLLTHLPTLFLISTFIILWSLKGFWSNFRLFGSWDVLLLLTWQFVWTWSQQLKMIISFPIWGNMLNLQSDLGARNSHVYLKLIKNITAFQIENKWYKSIHESTENCYLVVCSAFHCNKYYAVLSWTCLFTGMNFLI